MKTKNITYRSAVDIWLIVLLIGLPAYLLYDGINRIQAGNEQHGWILIAITVFSVLPIYLLLFPCRYTLTDRSIKIQCGVGAITDEEIEYSKIEDVSPSWNILSAPALSLRRVKIKTGKGLMQFALISPVNRNEFIQELNRRRSLHQNKQLSS